MIKKTQYNVFQNVHYILHNLWQNDKKAVFAILSQTPVLVLLPLITAFLPKIILDELSQKAPLQRFHNKSNPFTKLMKGESKKIAFV